MPIDFVTPLCTLEGDAPNGFIYCNVRVSISMFLLIYTTYEFDIRQFNKTTVKIRIRLITRLLFDIFTQFLHISWMQHKVSFPSPRLVAIYIYQSPPL